jgi:hypothetical protein
MITVKFFDSVVEMRLENEQEVFDRASVMANNSSLNFVKIGDIVISKSTIQYFRLDKEDQKEVLNG